MSNVDQLNEYILWYFSGLMPVQFKVIAGYIKKLIRPFGIHEGSFGY